MLLYMMLYEVRWWKHAVTLQQSMWLKHAVAYDSMWWSMLEECWCRWCYV